MAFKIEDKDWSRMLDLVVANKDGEGAAALIKDKRKAIARFICGLKLSNGKPSLDYWGKEYGCAFSDFGNKALKLGATLEEIQMVFDSVETPEKYLETKSELKDKKLNNRFIGTIVNSILKKKMDVKFLPHNGYAITQEGKDVMRRNGRKWTIGYKMEITKGDKKVALVFDAVTCEGDGPTYFLVETSDSDRIFNSMSSWKGVSKLKFTKQILASLEKI